MSTFLAREKNIPYRALAPQNIGNSAVNGDAIVQPWRLGRRGLFVVIAGAMTTNDSLTFTVQARRQGTSTWDAVKQKNGNDLTFTAQANSGAAGTKGGRLKNDGVLHGELDFNMIKLAVSDGAAFDYDAIRISGINAVAQNVLCGAIFTLTDLFDRPHKASRDLEDLYDKTRYSGGDPNVEP